MLALVICLARLSDVNGGSYVISGKTMTISGTTIVQRFKVDEALTDNKLTRDDLEEVIIEEGVTEIEAGSFNESGLGDIKLPESLTVIGDSAFESCYVLMQSKYGDKLIIPAAVTVVGNSAFRNCRRLNLEFAPNSKVKVIKSYAFANNMFLESINLPSSLEEIHDYAFSTCEFTSISIPENVHTIGTKIVDNWDFEEYIVDPKNTKFSTHEKVLIQGDILKGCPNAFDGNFTVPSYITVLGPSAFQDVRNLKYINLPNGLKEIGDSCFWGVNNMNSIVIPKTVEKIGYRGFYQTYMENCTFESPSNIRIIGESAFDLARYLKYINTEALVKVTTLETRVFAQLTEVTKFVIPAGVTVLKNYSVYGMYCTSLVILGSIQSMDNSSIDSMYELTEIKYCGKTSVTAVDKVTNVDKLQKVYVPKNYQANNFAGLPVEKTSDEFCQVNYPAPPTPTPDPPTEAPATPTDIPVPPKPNPSIDNNDQSGSNPNPDKSVNSKTLGLAIGIPVAAVVVIIIIIVFVVKSKRHDSENSDNQLATN